jgi:hypothetical protein
MAGVHSLSRGTPAHPVESFSVNVDPDEGRLSFLDSAALVDLAPDSAFRSLEKWQPATPSMLRSSQRSRLSRMLLIVVLGLLLVDQLMTWKFRMGLAALALLVGAAPAATVGGRSGVLMALVAVSLLGALLITLFARSRASRGPAARRVTERLGADRF